VFFSVRLLVRGAAVLSVRPKIAELVVQLYGRALHPELVEVFSERRFQRGEVAPLPGHQATAGVAPAVSAPSAAYTGYEATVQITGAGHLVTWRCGGLTLTEVCASTRQSLPTRRRLLSRRVEGSLTDRFECRGGVVYEVSVTLETATPQAFLAYQKEFDLMALQTGASLPKSTSGLLHRFDASGRAGLSLGAVSYVDVQARDKAFRVRALHTFPDDYALVRTESVIRLPG
jgi:hypothetical protein